MSLTIHSTSGASKRKDDFSRSQIRGVPVEAELLGIEGRARGDERLGLLVRAFPQTGDDHQAVHWFLLRVGFSEG